MPTVNADEYYSTAEAAEELGIAAHSVRRYCLNHVEGKKPALKGTLMGRSWFIHQDDLEAYLNNRKSVGRPPQK